MDAWIIADALMTGRRLPRARLLPLLRGNGAADALYAGLFQIVGEPIRSRSVEDAVALPSPHPPTAEASAYILDYAATPNGGNYAKMVRAARGDSDTGGTVIRLAPLVLASSHRRRFITIVEQMARQRPSQAIDLQEVCRNLTQRGPDRLYGFRRVAAAKRYTNRG